MWDEHYSRDEYVYGTEPNGFLASCEKLLAPGQSALCVADGEGRNSVWLASQGLNVTAFDASRIAVEKARKLASRSGVQIDYRISDVDEWNWEADRFDIVAAIFIQFAPPVQRSTIFEGMKRTLLPGGYLLLQGYRPEQIGYGTGGPSDPEQLYTRALIEDAFGDFEIVALKEYDRDLHEGSGHSGMSALMDVIVRKPILNIGSGV